MATPTYICGCYMCFKYIINIHCYCHFFMCCVCVYWMHKAACAPSGKAQWPDIHSSIYSISMTSEEIVCVCTSKVIVQTHSTLTWIRSNDQQQKAALVGITLQYAKKGASLTKYQALFIQNLYCIDSLIKLCISVFQFNPSHIFGSRKFQEL